jgi:HD-GYP domain-containing protein (c-di-GMP phosphodiesterase class II)
MFFRYIFPFLDSQASLRDKKSLLLITGIGITLVCCALLVYATGGTKGAYVQSLYLPILVSAYSFGTWGGIVSGLVGGLLSGPFMPLDVNIGIMQEPHNWIYRTIFFVFVGILVGKLVALLRFRLRCVEELLKEMSQTHARTLKVFARSISLRDEDTGGHCERVAHDAYVLGKYLGLDKRELNLLYWAGLLHDLGKIAIPEDILLKNDRLTDLEYEQVKCHVGVGADMLKAISPDFDVVVEGIRSHHERWDGTGYPNGLKGEGIPLSGRILAVADVFEALTSKRPYREPSSAQETLDYIMAKAGRDFDPAVTEALQRMYEKGFVLVEGYEDDMSVELEIPKTYSTSIIWSNLVIHGQMLDTMDSEKPDLLKGDLDQSIS